MNTLIKRNAYPSLFNDFFNDRVFNDAKPWTDTRVLVNIKENKDGFVLEIAAPGFKKSDFNIELENDNLKVWTGKAEEKKKEDDDFKYTRKEFNSHSFSRQFSLSEKHVDGNGIVAKYENGILSIGVPKEEDAKEKPARAIKVS